MHEERVAKNIIDLYQTEGPWVRGAKGPGGGV